MVTQEMLAALKNEYELEISRKISEIEHLQTKVEVLDDLARVCFENPEETETETETYEETQSAQTEELSEQLPVEENTYTDETY